MIAISSAQWQAWMAALFWPFLRLLGLLLADPVLGNPAVPRPALVGFALLVSMLLAPVLPTPPAIEAASPQGLLIGAEQLLIGLAMGFVVRLALTAVETGGQIMGLQMGLGFAVFFDPQSAGQTAVMGQYLSVFASLVFLAMNGHAMVLSALAESFRSLPVSATPPGADGLRTLVLAGGTVFSAGLSIALPVVAALLIANVGLGVITRAAPQLNLFAVGFPVTLALGFLAVALVLPQLVPGIESVFESAFQDLGGVLAGLRPGSGGPR